MIEETKSDDDLAPLSDATLADLVRRVQDISNGYRSVAEKMGQLYMRADSLDKPMRNASDNEQTFSAILDDLRLQVNRRR